MAVKDLKIKVGVQGADKAERQLGKTEKGMKSIGSAALKVGGAFFAARGVISGISSVIRLAGEQEKAEKSLEVALGRTSKTLLDQASALQKVTTFGDEAIIGVQASIGAFIDSEEAISKATEATLDIAVAMGMDLKSAGDLVAKTLGSSTNAMSRYGIEVTGAVGSTERLESLTKNVANLFGGQAKAQAETMAGSLQQAENAAGDLAEAIGAKLSPFIKVIAEDFTTASESLTSFIGPQIISREEQLVDLLSQRASKIGDITEKTNEAISVDELFNQVFEERRNIDKETADTSISIIDKQLEKYHDLIFAEEKTLELKRAEIDFGNSIKEVTVKNIDLQSQLSKAKKEQVIQDLKSAALQQGSAIDAMKAVVRAESMEAVAGYISSVLKNVPFPANLILAAGGGALVSGLIDKGLSSFATGGDFITSGPQMIMVGDNPGGQERVQVTPLSSPNLSGSQNGVTVNIQGNMIGNESFVRDTLIPEIAKAQNQGLA